MDAKTRDATVSTAERGPLGSHGLDLSEVLRIARREKITVLAVIGVFLVASILYLHVAKRKYAVRMVVTGVQSNQSSSSGTLDEISSLAGVDLPGAGNSQFKLFVGALRSPYAAQAVAADQELLKAMYPREWSASEGRWRQPPSSIRRGIQLVLSTFGFYFPPWAPPGASRVADYLKDELKIVPDSKSGTVTMEIDSDRPEVAQRVLQTMIDSMDERMRQRDLKRATVDIGYLTERLASVSVEDYRRALVTNLVQQEKQRMLASAPLPYVSDVLGNPMVSSRPVSPVPLAVLVAAVVLGWLVGVAIAVG